MTLYEAIFRRKSIRKYRDTEIDPKLLEKIEQYGEDAVGIRPEIRTKWKILKGSDKRLAGLFLVKAPYYVVLYSEICEDYRKNAGCLMEQLVLYLHTKGIGSCYQGGALRMQIQRQLFHKASCIFPVILTDLRVEHHIIGCLHQKKSCQTFVRAF